jgi:two-component system NtrC family sensor kinase
MSWFASGGTAVGMLRLLLAASVAVPALLFAVVATVDYRAAFAGAARDAIRTSEVACEHAAKVFDTHRLVADRAIDVLADLDDAAIERTEASLHDRFARLIQGLPQVQSFLVVGADGHPLAATDRYPVARAVDFSDRDYFTTLRDSDAGIYVSKVQVSRMNGKVFFGLGRRRDEAGRFAGVVDIAVAPAYFAHFYQTLIGEEDRGQASEVVTLVREDGQILVRYPNIDGMPPVAPRTAPFFTAITASPDGGSYVGRSVVDQGSPRRLFYYRRVPGFPVYVVVGRSTAAILAGWYGDLANDLLFGLPATVALCAFSWIALRRTQREQAALARLRAEMQRRETAEAALRQAQRLESVGRLTGGVAHDFNNLLTIVMGSIETMMARAEDPSRVRRLGANALQAARRGSDITHKLLAFARRQLVRPERVDLNRLLREFKPLLDHGAGDAVVVTLDLADGPTVGWIDPGQFEAVVLNLVINARDAAPGGGCVTIRTGHVELAGHEIADLPAGRYLLVAVVDDGTGMDSATAERAFEPFFTTKETGKGTGLGLSQVYGFAKQAGGHARIVSAPGAGTTVELLLPDADNAASAAAVAAEAIALRPANEGEVVLIVEDEPSVLEMATESLGELGYTIYTAANGAAALDWLRGPGRIDVLFSDVAMPGGMSGVELALEGRRLRPSLKVLLTSGYAASAGDGVLPADVPLLAKPYDRGELANRLRTVLSG